MTALIKNSPRLRAEAVYLSGKLYAMFLDHAHGDVSGYEPETTD